MKRSRLQSKGSKAHCRQLSRLGVDVCEAGFPIASEGDFHAVERIAKEVGHLTTGRAEGRKPMVFYSINPDYLWAC